MRLVNKVALVTGGGVRLGQAMACFLAHQGMHVAVHYHQSKEEAEATLDKMDGGSTRNAIFQANLSNLEEIENLVTQVEQNLGPIDVLINNAADFFPTPLGDVTEEQWDHLFAVNLKAPFFLAQRVGKSMKSKGLGKIINIVDVSAERPWPNYLPYCTTKSGLLGLTKGLAKALSPEVQVNGIAPGTVLPPPESSNIDTSLSVENSLLKRMGSPDDIVKGLEFLLHSDFVTGVILPVDGGRLLA